MITECIFIVISLVSNVVLCNTVLRLVYILSTQTLSINDSDAPTLTLFTMNVCLVVIFMSQHSGLASVTYRKKMEDWGLQPISRCVYVLMTGLALQLMMSMWQPISEVKFWIVDTSDSPLLWLFFHILHWILWIILFLEVLVMEPLHLVGIKQVYHYMRSWHQPSFYHSPRLRRLLANMPHPGAGCFVAILWIHPCMTFDRMILATVLTAYLCCGYSLTEKDYMYVNGCSQYVFSRKTSWEVQKKR